MFKCGDKVIYKSFGVCTIEQTDYVLESMDSKGGDVPPRLYFVLKSESARGGQAFVIDRADAINLAQQLSEIEPETYIDKNMHTTDQHFREELAQHDCITSMRVARTMEHRIAEQEATGHKPSALYIRLLDAARKQVQEEYAAALGLSIEEADEYLKKATSQA